MKAFFRNKSSGVHTTPFVVHRPGTLALGGSTWGRNPMVRDALENNDIPISQNPVNRFPVCIGKLAGYRGYTIDFESSESRIEGLLGHRTER